jgi:predicted nuclease of restriction endonuclease-like (RecB) superfamily
MGSHLTYPICRISGSFISPTARELTRQPHKRTLERQIHTFYYERILKRSMPEKMLAQGQG